MLTCWGESVRGCLGACVAPDISWMCCDFHDCLDILYARTSCRCLTHKLSNNSSRLTVTLKKESRARRTLQFFVVCTMSSISHRVPVLDTVPGLFCMSLSWQKLTIVVTDCSETVPVAQETYGLRIEKPRFLTVSLNAS